MTPAPVARLWQQAEGAIAFVAGLAIAWHSAPFPWWAGLLLFFAPDLSFAGYALGNRAGAAIYNAVHLYAPGLVLFALGLILSAPLATALGGLWVAHCGMDRMLGYGLKSPDGFGITHLGPIGRR